MEIVPESMRARRASRKGSLSLANAIILKAMRNSHPRSEKLWERISIASNYQERIDILRHERQFAQDEFPVQLKKLENLLLEYNPFAILATFGFIDLTYLPDVGRAMNASDNIDQYHVEIIQALILCHDESEFKKRHFDPPEFQELRDLTSYVGYLHSAKDFPNPSDTSSTAEFSRLHFQSMLRLHTKGIRNWGYEGQTLAVLKQLYAPMEEIIERELGVRICLLIDTVCAELCSIGHKLQEHFTKGKSFMQQNTVEGAVEAYLREFRDHSITIAKVHNWIRNDGWTFENVQVLLFHRSTSFLLTVFAFEETSFARAYPKASDSVQRVLSSWVIELGELRDSNKEHFFLQNPVWLRPIVRVTPNILFWPIPTLFHSFCFDMVETLVCIQPALKEKYLKRRGEFLEQYTFELFCKKFSDAETFRGSQWKNEATKKNGENDLLVLLDSVALVIEEKSGAINPVAKRGGDSIKQEIQQLITEAGEQANVFARLLQDDRKVHEFQTKAGIVNKVDTTNIRQFHCLSITMEHFGMLATRLPELKSAGLARNGAPQVLTMSVSDLEIVLEVLQTPFEFLHYLTRRAAFELRGKFLGDELDLLVFYLETGFAEKNLPDRDSPILIVGLARKLDKYFMKWPGDDRFERPRRHLSEWWIKILDAIEKKRVHRRYEIGCLLLDMPDEEQMAFESQFRELCQKVKHAKHIQLENVEAIWNPVKSGISNAVIVAAPVTADVYPKRGFVVERFAERAMGETDASQALVILVDVELQHWPYSGLYLLDRKDFRSRGVIL
jgi:hypothetical protein